MHMSDICAKWILVCFSSVTNIQNKEKTNKQTHKKQNKKQTRKSNTKQLQNKTKNETKQNKTWKVDKNNPFFKLPFFRRKLSRLHKKETMLHNDLFVYA